MQVLANWLFGISGLDDAVDLRGELTDYARGSRNLMPDGTKQSRPFRGLEFLAAGSRRQFQIKDTYGGLDDIGDNHASGSLFSTIADMLVYIGRGQVSIEGEDIPGAVASGVLRFLLKWNGSYTNAKSGPYAAGLPEPSAPSIGTINSTVYSAANITGTAAIKYARLRKTTGGRSRASASSVVLTVTNKAVFAVIPNAIAGQTHHVFFAIDPKLGLGNFYRVARANPFTQAEYTEEDVEREVIITGLPAGDILETAVPTFTSADIGKKVVGITGISISNPTVISEVISPTQIRLSNGHSYLGSAIKVKLIAYAAGIDRSVVISLRAADLTEEIAWIYDFPPPSGSHAFQLETRMFVVGYADTANQTNSASADAAGTVLLPSISDYFESYDPRFPTYLPEAVVDILTDGMSSYKFIGGRNGIYAAQFLNVTNSTPLTLSILLRGEGITTPENWCARKNAIYLFTAKGRPVRIIEGGVVDTTFSAKVVHKMRDWNPKNVIVTSHPAGGGAVYSHQNESIFFDESTNRWSSELSLSDFADGVAISSVTTQSQMILTMENEEGEKKAYYFDKGTGSYICAIGHYQNNPGPQFHKIIQQIKAECVVDRLDKGLFLAIHSNTLPTHVGDGAIEAGSHVFTSASAKFTDELIGSYLLVNGAGAGGFLMARIIDVPNPTTLHLGTVEEDLRLSVPKNAATSVNNGYALIGFRIYPIKPNRLGTIEIDSRGLYLNGIHTYAASIIMETIGKTAQGLRIDLSGEVIQETGWTLPSSVFNEFV